MFGLNFNKQITDFLNQHLGEIGQVTDFDFSGGNVTISIALKGEKEIVTLRATELCYDVSDGKMNLYYSSLTATKEWLNEIFKMISAKTGNTFSFPDSLRLMPLKMLIPKKR